MIAAFIKFTAKVQKFYPEMTLLQREPEEKI
jgi:hypothetical protein